jgi:hypothetical protein
MPTQIDLVLGAKNLFDHKQEPPKPKKQNTLTQSPYYQLFTTDVFDPPPTEAIQKLTRPFNTKTWTEKSATIVTTKIIMRQLIAPEENHCLYYLLGCFKKILTNKYQFDCLDLAQRLIIKKQITKEQTFEITEALTHAIAFTDIRPSDEYSISTHIRKLLWEILDKDITPTLKAAIVIMISSMLVYLPIPERRKLEKLIKKQLETRGILTQKQKVSLMRIRERIYNTRTERYY